MINKKFMILAIFLVGLLAVSTASAADNATSDIVNVENQENTAISDIDNDLSSNIDENILNANAKPKTFTDLKELIDNGEKDVYLNDNYLYDKTTDGYLPDITISHAVTIHGNGHTIDVSHAGRIFSVGYSNKEVKDVIFQDIVLMNSDGSAISVNWFSECTVVNCTFINNHVKGSEFFGGYGGAISDGDGSKCEITAVNCTFINNSANNGGGAISHCSAVNCIFINNTAGSYGGAIAYYDSIVNCTFVGNSAKKGGAIYIYNDYQADVVNCTFVDNSAEYGGAIYVHDKGECTALNCVFVANHATSSGKDNDMYGGSAVNCRFYDKLPTVISAPDVSVAYGVSKNLIATLKDIIGNPVFDVNVKITVGNLVKTLKTNSKGQVSIAIPTNLAPNTYTATISYAGNDEYKASSTTAKVTVNKLTSVVSADDITVNSGDANGKFIATLTNAEGTPLSANIVINLNGIDYTMKTNSKGQASVSTADLAPGEYKATVTYKGNSKYAPSSATAKVIIVTDKLVSVVSADDVTVKYGDANGKFIATLTNAAGVPLSANIVINLNGKDYAMKTNSKGQGSVSTAKLAQGEYNATVTYKGNSKYAPSSATAKVTVKLASVVSASDVTVKYGDANGKFIATLTNAEGTPLSANIVINLNGVNYAMKTNSKGQASVSTAKLKVGEYKATVIYKGNSKYAPSTTTAKVIVTDKLISKVSAEDVTVDYGDANGKFIATLTNAAGVPLSANIVINLNGVNYALKTNSKGQASVSTKDLEPGEYKATVTYKGNSKYAPSTTTVKVTVRAPTKITGTYNPKTKEVIGTLTNAEGTPLSANVVVNLNGVNHALKSDSKGQFKVSTADLAPGSYTAKLTYKGNSKYAPSSATVKVAILN
ncbi:Ig-like domain repeat protein [Methanobrevibacter sp.]|uniref:Ig-like domain repeat protein n=1 Tax=Methanobrevibacter sp. TaxID=66852 RepID=UPI00386C699E